MGVEKALIETMIKHLPPSASTLRLLDLNGAAATILARCAPIYRVTVDLPADDSSDENRFDAVVAADAALDDDLLRAALHVLRPGGRLIAVDPQKASRAARRSSGWKTRDIREFWSRRYCPTGVLMRGEKPHITDDTLARIQSVACAIKDAADFKGRYVHLLIRQTPNKPVWALKAAEVVEWQAVALSEDGDPLLLAFSSLPNAVAFMQPAVLSGGIRDVNKVAKFSRAVAQNWRLLINPPLEVLEGREVVFVPVDPSQRRSPRRMSDHA